MLKEYKELQSSNLSHQDISAFLREKIQSHFDYTFQQKNVARILEYDNPMHYKIDNVVSHIEKSLQLSFTKLKKNILINHIYSLISIVKNTPADSLFLFDKGLVINKLDYFEEVKKYMYTYRGNLSTKLSTGGIIIYVFIFTKVIT